MQFLVRYNFAKLDSFSLIILMLNITCRVICLLPLQTDGLGGCNNKNREWKIVLLIYKISLGNFWKATNPILTKLSVLGHVHAAAETHTPSPFTSSLQLVPKPSGCSAEKQPMATLAPFREQSPENCRTPDQQAFSGLQKNKLEWSPVLEEYRDSRANQKECSHSKNGSKLE